MLKWIIAVLALAGAAIAEPSKRYEIYDNEGFKAPQIAFTVEVPQSWSVSGKISWLKPCSGNDHYELIFTARSPDGRSGFRIMPGYQLLWMEPVVTGFEPALAQIFVAQLEAERNNLATQWRGSNCHVVRTTGTPQMIQALLVGKRPAGAQVIKTEPDAQKLLQYKQQFDAPQQGMQIFYDAQLVTLRYPLGGTEVEETASLSWYTFQLDPLPGGAGTFYQQTVVEQFRLGWIAPERRTEDEAALAAIAASFKVDPNWQSEITRFHSEVAEANRKAQAENARISSENWKAAQERRERQHQEFMTGVLGLP